MEFNHKPVLLSECIDGLNIKNNGVYVDCTLGGGGHSEEICKRITNGKLICIDKDIEAINHNKERLKRFSNITYINSDFKNLKQILADLKIDQVDGILADLGVSSYQLDNPERGFSYMKDANLDMRMNRNQELTAYTILNTYSEQQIGKILRDYGEEQNWYKIAKNIVNERKKNAIVSTTQFVDIIKMSYPEKFLHTGSHPAKKAFQAIRIAVNGELEDLDSFIDDAISLLKPSGRMAVITFHSLEDRIVKVKFVEYSQGCTCPKELPKCVCGKKEIIKLINKKPILATQSELLENKRSQSAKLRIIEKRRIES